MVRHVPDNQRLRPALRRLALVSLLILCPLAACAGSTPPPHQGKPPEESPVTRSSPERPATVTLLGTAHDAKGGAVIDSEQHGVVYVEGLDFWPDALHGKRVRARGELVEMKLIPDPAVGPDGAISQGAVGKQTVLRGATWELAEDSEK